MPHEWLRASIRGSGWSEGRIASLIGVDKHRMSHWLNNDEAIPLWAMVSVAQIAEPKWGADYATALMACYDIAGSLKNMPAGLFKERSINKGIIGSLLVRVAEDFAFRNLADGSISYILTLRNNLVAAKQVLSWVEAVYAKDAQLITDANVEQHITYPFNIFTGALMDVGLGERRAALLPETAATTRDDTELLGLRTSLLRSLETAAEQTRRIPQHKDYFLQHSVHLLARHGDAKHQRYAEELLQSPTTHLLTKRMAFYGLSISKQRDAFHDRFLHELRRNHRMRTATIAFDAVHYGDARLIDRELPKNCTTFANVVVNTIRHLQSNSGYDIKTLAIFKLLAILENAGPEEFRDPNVRKQLPAIVQNLKEDLNCAHNWLKEKVSNEFRNAGLLENGKNGTRPRQYEFKFDSGTLEA